MPVLTLSENFIERSEREHLAPTEPELYVLDNVAEEIEGMEEHTARTAEEQVKAAEDSFDNEARLRCHLRKSLRAEDN